MMDKPRNHPKIQIDRRLRLKAGKYDHIRNKIYFGYCPNKKTAIATLKHEITHWAHDLFLTIDEIDSYMIHSEGIKLPIYEKLAYWLE
jgi:hypothetical protein